MFHVVVCSEDEAEVEAAKTTLPLYMEEYHLSFVMTSSGLSTLPLSDNEAQQGALNRIDDAKRTYPEADMYIAFEDSLRETHLGRILAGWCIVDTRARILHSLGQSAGILLPAEIPLTDDMDLKALTSTLTQGEYTRVDEFRDALRMTLAAMMAPVSRPQRLYEDLAPIYDKLYSWKNYEGEAKQVMRHITREMKSDGRELLDVACGTGNHLQYFAKHFDSTGIDLHEPMLKIAERKVPDALILQADMTAFSLGRQFDAITCLFNALGCLPDRKSLLQTFRCFADHLKPGGVLIAEPFLSRYESGAPSLLTYRDKDLVIARALVSEFEGEYSIGRRHYLIAQRGQEVHHIVDSHPLFIVSPEELVAMLATVGLRGKFVKKPLGKGKGLLIATRPRV